MSSPAAPRTAVVAGAGPGGAAAALLLARVGCAVTVLERVAAPTAIGGALLIQPNGRAVLQGLGLDDAALPSARTLRASRIHDDRGRTLLEAPVAAGGGPGLDANVVVRRSALFGALHEALVADERITVRLGVTASEVDEAGVHVTSADGADVIAADVVVAADGARSALRAGIAPTAEVRSGPTYVRAIVRSSVTDDVAGEWWTGLGLFGTAPLGDGTSYVFGSAAHPDLAAALDAGDVAAFAARWGDELRIAGEVFSHVDTAEQLIVSRTDTVHSPTFVRGRAALLGDAAHAMVPNSGQGANSALLDAAVLALELAAAPEVAPALAAYDRRRRPAVTRTQADAARLARLAHATRGPLRLARNGVLRTAARLPAGRQAQRLHQEDPSQIRSALLSL